MNQNSISFILNSNEKFVLDLQESLDCVHCCYEAPIIFFHDASQIVIASDFVRYNISGLSHLLSKVLAKQLMLHSSIIKDIGYLYNEYLQGLYSESLQKNKELVYEKMEGIDHWVGEAYKLFDCNPTTWLYNDYDENIILEITPNYPWHFSEPKEGEDFIPYEEWIKSYKPVLIRAIPVEVARQWLEQANMILKKIEENVARFEREHAEK